MTLFESDIQELIYGILIGDPILLTYLGGDSIDTRVRLSLGDSKPQKISAMKPACIVIEAMPVTAPVRLGSGIDEWTEQYCLHIFTRPEGRYLRAAIVERLRELLHGRSFVTTRFIVYQVFENGREGVITETNLYDYRYAVSLQFLPKGS